MAKRYFTDGNCNEYWNIHTVLDDDYEEYSITIHCGKIGTKGQTNEKAFDCKEKCEDEALRIITEKIKNGYVESRSVDLHYFMGISPNEVKTDEQLFNVDSITKIEQELGYKIPQLYIDLMKIKNGDKTRRKIGDDILDMTGFKGINALADMKDSTEDWGYPDIGIYFSWTESAGHEALLLNYKECFTEGEPSVWLLDQECEYGRFLARNFKEFIEQLYFEEFSERYNETIKKHYPEHYDDQDGVTKEFSKDWDFEYNG